MTRKNKPQPIDPNTITSDIDLDELPLPDPEVMEAPARALALWEIIEATVDRHRKAVLLEQAGRWLASMPHSRRTAIRNYHAFDHDQASDEHEYTDRHHYPYASCVTDRDRLAWVLGINTRLPQRSDRTFFN